jgi:hypothetical protein
MRAAQHLCNNLTKLYIFPQIIIKASIIKVDTSPCSGMRADKFGDKVEGRTDLIELRSALRDLCENTCRPYQHQAVSRRAPTVQKRVQSKVRSPEICR